MKHSNNKPLVASLLALSIASPGLLHAADLVSIYAEAKQQDLSLAASQQAYQAGKEKANQGKGLFLPQVNASASLSYNKQKNSYSPAIRPETDETYDSRQLSLSVVQPLYNKSNWANYQQSKLVSDQAETVLSQAEQDLIVRVAEAYFGILGAQEGVQVAKAQKAAFAESLERAKLTFKIGTATITDKLEAQARFDLARAEEIAANNELEVAHQRLRSIVGKTFQNLDDVMADARLPQIRPQSIEEWVEIGIQNSLGLKQAQQSVDISQQGLQQARGGHYPTVDLIAQASNQQQYVSFVDADSTTDAYSVAVELNVPLYSGGITSSQVREAAASYEEAKNVRDETRRQVTLQVQQAYLAVINGFLQMEALQQAVASSASALKATKKGLEVGVRTNLDLLDAQQQYFSTRRDLALAEYDYLVNILRLKAAAGVLNASDIEETNGFLAS